MHRSVSFVRCGRMLGRPLTCSYTQRILIDSNPKAAASIVLLHHQSKRYQSTQSIPNQARRFSLKDQIIQKIKFTGPITIHEYMRSVLTSPNSGFYMKQDVFGSKGHFITSPEISQVFGELIGVWLLHEWQRFSSPKPLRIVELGPGRGTLMNDITRVFSQFSKARDCLSISLVEISPLLRQVQEQNLCGHTSVLGNNELETHSSLTKYGFPITWYSNLDLVPEKSGFTVYLAHEFFDALPIHKFKRNESGEWREVLIDFENGPNNKDILRYVLARHETPASKVYIPDDVQGNDFEVCPEAALLVDKIGKRLNNNPGVMLACDYGYSQRLTTSTIIRDTFRSFREHALWHPLEKPGTADLTADVDFDFLRKVAEPQSTCFGPITQQQFLNSMGVDVRLNKLLQTAESERAKENLKSGVKMITEEMGQRFAFLAMFPKESHQLFGNDPPAAFQNAR